MNSDVDPNPRRAATKFSTCTLSGDEIVPWLASSGELAYTPKLPPANDDYFQYSRVLPEVLNEVVDLRQPLWFGARSRNDSEVQRLLEFWRDAARVKPDEVFTAYGSIQPEVLSAPIAVYRHRMYGWADDKAILIQHGSYQMVEPQSQPYLSAGEVILYKGIDDAPVFNFYLLAFEENRLDLMQIHAGNLHDSVLSFNYAHAFVVRSETNHLSRRNPFPASPGIRKRDLNLESFAIRSYTLDERVAAQKFGPNYVKFRTPLTNIRITSFFCGEAEVKVIDNEKLEVIETVGCKSNEVWLDEGCHFPGLKSTQ